MNKAETVSEILDKLAQVQRIRQLRCGNPLLDNAVLAVKRYQQGRFERTYSDLLASARHASAARFFLDDLYGPADHSLRDEQFAKVVPAMARLFPFRVVETVHKLGQLHALSEELDLGMAQQLADPLALDESTYRRLWRAVGRRQCRDRQLDLVLSIGGDLDDLTRSWVLRRALHMMRPAANAAGLAALQGFLEAGFDAFAEMGGAQDFLAIVSERERRLFDELFGPIVSAKEQCLPGAVKKQ